MANYICPFRSFSTFRSARPSTKKLTIRTFPLVRTTKFNKIPEYKQKHEFLESMVTKQKIIRGFKRRMGISNEEILREEEEEAERRKKNRQTAEQEKTDKTKKDIEAVITETNSDTKKQITQAAKEAELRIAQRLRQEAKEKARLTQIQNEQADKLVSTTYQHNITDHEMDTIAGKLGEPHVSHPSLTENQAEDAREALRRIVGLETANSKEILRANAQLAVAHFGRTGPLDTGSTEVQAAILHLRIITLTEHVKRCRRDTHNRVKLGHLIDKRNNMMKYLRRQSIARYQKLVNDMGIVLKPDVILPMVTKQKLFPAKKAEPQAKKIAEAA